MKRLLLMLFAFVAVAQSFAAKSVAKGDNYKIDIVAPQLKNHKVNLGVYFYGKLHSRDSVMLDDKGMGAFEKDKKLAEGMYVVYYSSSNYFDLLIADDQHFAIRIDTTDFNKNVITGAEQTEAFANYVKYLADSRQKVAAINEKYGKEKDADKKSAEIDAIDKAVKNYQQQLKTTYAGKTIATYLKATEQVEIPEFEQLENDSVRRVAKYYYYRQHFFDNLNLSDPCLVYSPFLEQKVNYYIEKMVPQIPDTLNVEIVSLVEKSRGDTLTFQNMLSNMLNYAIKSNMMGMDRIILTLSEKYYLSGEAFWADSALLAQLKTEVSKIKYNQIGDPARDLVVEEMSGSKLRVSSLDADYILLFFFEPTCGHCKKETPKLYDTVYQKYKDQRFAVVCFYIQENKEEWETFVNEHHLYDENGRWRNVWDPNRESYFWYFYDVSTTPGVYLIDKDRKLMAKKISVETLDSILEHEFGLDK